MKLREYIGPSALEAVLELAPGEISEPVRSGMGVHLLRLIDATPATQPSFEEIEPQIRSEWVRRAGDRALRDYLDQLRADGDVQILNAQAELIAHQLSRVRSKHPPKGPPPAAATATLGSPGT